MNAEQAPQTPENTAGAEQPEGAERLAEPLDAVLVNHDGVGQPQVLERTLEHGAVEGEAPEGELPPAADPAAGPLWRNLAHAHRLAGDAEGERAALNQALAIDQRDFAAQLRMAQLHERLGEETQALMTWSGVQQLAAAQEAAQAADARLHELDEMLAAARRRIPAGRCECGAHPAHSPDFCAGSRHRTHNDRLSPQDALPTP